MEPNHSLERNVAPAELQEAVAHYVPIVTRSAEHVARVRRMTHGDLIIPDFNRLATQMVQAAEAQTTPVATTTPESAIPVQETPVPQSEPGVLDLTAIRNRLPGIYEDIDREAA